MKKDPTQGEVPASEFAGSAAGDELALSPTVSSVKSAFGSKDAISAVKLVKAILQSHTEYAHHKASSVPLDESDLDAKRPVAEWLQEVRTLFDPEGASTLHGRLVIIGLGLLQPHLRQQLNREGIFEALVSELKEPIKEILTDRGWALYTPTESVPNLPDNPLNKLNQDQLGRAAFARFLAKRISEIKEEDGAYAIHLYGPWGAGKSTLLNFLRTILEQQRQWLVVEFNAWRHQHIRPPWWALLDSVFWQTRKGLNWLDRVRERWWRFSAGRGLYFISILVLVILAAALFFVVSKWLNHEAETTSQLILKSLAQITALAVVLWGAAKWLSRFLLFGSVRAAQSYMESSQNPMNVIKARFVKLTERLRPWRVAVLIDDLDRCESRYVVELLEGIQTLFRDAPVIFVVSADLRWLNACYEETYDKLKPWVHAPGKSLGTLFLEKIFQLSTPVPGVPDELKQRFWYHLIGLKTTQIEREWQAAKQHAKDAVENAANESVLLHVAGESRGKSFIEQQAIREEVVVRLADTEVAQHTEHALKKFAPLLEPNPRAMKRLVNAYSTNRALALLSYVDIDRDQLALWTILSLRWPRLADYFANQPAMFEKMNLDEGDSFPDEIRTLMGDQAVKEVLDGGPTQIPLHAEIVRQCALLRV